MRSLHLEKQQVAWIERLKQGTEEAVEMVRMTKSVAVATKPGLGNVPSTSEIHVLAVDDSLVDRKVIEKLLKTSSYKVTTVDSALRALEILGIVDGESSSATNGIQIHMIITDYCMPQMTGYDLLKRVKGTSALKEIPVVIMSSENVETRINSCYEEGAEDFIIKPVRLADVKRLGSHFSREKDLSTTTSEALGSMTRKKRKRSEALLLQSSKESSERRSQSMRLTVP